MRAALCMLSVGLSCRVCQWSPSRGPPPPPRALPPTSGSSSRGAARPRARRVVGDQCVPRPAARLRLAAPTGRSLVAEHSRGATHCASELPRRPRLDHGRDMTRAAASRPLPARHALHADPDHPSPRCMVAAAADQTSSGGRHLVLARRQRGLESVRAEAADHDSTRRGGCRPPRSDRQGNL